MAGLETALRRYLEANEQRSVGESVQNVDQETLKRLEALGYVQANTDSLSGFTDILDFEGLLDPKDRIGDIALFSEAKAALAAQNWNLAEGLYRKLVERSPQNARGYQGLAVLYGQIQDWDRALENLDLAIQHQPGSEDLQRFLGQLLIEMGEVEDGVEVLSALPSREADASTCIWLGIGYRQLGRGDDAKSWFRRGLALEGDNQWLLLYLGNQLASEKSYQEAEELYRKAIRVAPYFYLTFYNYGVMLVEQGEPSRAAGLIRRSAELNPQHGPSRQALAQLRRMGVLESPS